jgi:hypothetical protein
LSYKVNETFSVQCGFAVTSENVLHAATVTNHILAKLPASLFRSIDFKTTSAVLGAIFCENLADHTKAIVNPIEKGHPDILPASAANANEATLRNYPCGLEVKSTIGNVSTGLNLRAGVKRVTQVTGITWQAHHRDVRALMGLTWDFVQEHESFNFPAVTGVFYSADLTEGDWGEISGTTGRNTKVCGMRTSGRSKMGIGWILLWQEDGYEKMFKRHFPMMKFS